MTDRYDLVIMGMGSCGMVASEFAASLGLKVAVAERDRVGGDCLWTGCVPSKALLASAKVAHHMRTADRFGLDPVEPTVDRGGVWKRVRSVQHEIAATDDDPARFQEMGIDIVRGHARLTGKHSVQRRRSRALDPLRPPVHRQPAGGAGDPRSRRCRVRHQRDAVRAGTAAGELREHRRRAHRRRDGAGVRPPRHLGHAAPARRPHPSPRRTGARPSARRRAPPRGRRHQVRRRHRTGRGRERQEGRARHRGWSTAALGRRTSFSSPSAACRISMISGSRSSGSRPDPRASRSTIVDAPASTPSTPRAISPDVICSRTRPRYEGVRAVRDMFFPGKGRVTASVPWCTFTDPELAHAGADRSRSARPSWWRRRRVAARPRTQRPRPCGRRGSRARSWSSRTRARSSVRTCSPRRQAR